MSEQDAGPRLGERAAPSVATSGAAPSTDEPGQETEACLSALLKGRSSQVQERKVLAWSLSPHLRGGVFLAKLQERLENAVVVGWWLVVNDDTLFAAYDLAAGEFQYALQDADPVVFDEASVVQYFYDFYFAVWSEERSLVLSSAEVAWFTPLLPPERDLCDKMLRDNPIRVTARTDYHFELEACVLESDALAQCRFVVYHSAERLGVTTPNPALKGEMRPAMVGRSPVPPVPLLSALPTNYLVRRGERLGAFNTEFRVDADGWAAVGRWDGTRLLEDINRCVTPHLPPCRMRRRHLACYGMDLIELDCELLGRQARVLVLWRPGFAVAIDYRSNPVHYLNESLIAEQGWQLKDVAAAAEYLRFFCENVWGDEGPFIIIDSKEDRLLELFDYEKSEVSPQFADVDAALASLAPVTVSEADDRAAFHARAFILYGGSLFFAKFSIARTGLIDMNDDEPLVAFKLKPGASWPPRAKPFQMSDPPASSRRVVCSAEDFSKRLDAVESGRELVLENLTVWGAMRQEGRIMKRRVVLRNCRFRARLELRDLSCAGGMALQGCVFEGGLSLAGAKFEGPLRIEDCVALLPLDGTASLDLERIAARSLEVQRVWCRGDVSARLQTIEESADFVDIVLDGALSFDASSVTGSVTVRGTESNKRAFVSGDLSLSDLRAGSIQLGNLTVQGQLYVDRSVVNKHIDINVVSIGHGQRDRHLSLYNTVVELGFFRLGDAEVSGEVDARFLRVGTLFIVEGTAVPTHIGGDLLLSGATMPQAFRVRYVKIDGSIFGKALTAGTVRILGTKAPRPNSAPKSEDAPAELPPLSQATTVGGTIDLSDARIANEAVFLNVVCAAPASESARPSLDLHSATIGGNVPLFMAKEQARVLLETDDLPSEGLVSEFPGGARFAKAKLGGDIDVSHVSCEQGLIDFTDAIVTHDITISEQGAGARAKARALLLDSAKCAGCVDITGLDLDAAPSQQATLKHGHVLASNVELKQLRVSSATTSASIPGRLDLTASNLGSLELSVSSFDGECSNDCLERAGILLARATVGEVTMFLHAGKYPRPIDLRHAEIRWWEFSKDGRRVSDDPADYVELLRGDPNKQRHTWRSLESKLFDSGHEQAADVVHREMRAWMRGVLRDEVRARAGGWATLSGYVHLGALGAWDFATDSLTSPTRLLYTVAVWMAVSTYLFSIPANMTASDSALAATNTKLSEGATPQPGDWGAADGFWIAMRYHVPVAAFTARDDWQPSSECLTTVWQGASGNVRVWGSPEDYANVVMATHWMLWPIILIIISRQLLRRYEK